MTVRVGSVILIEDAAPAACELCGRAADLRPYGPDGKSICLECGSRDPEGSRRRMLEHLDRMLVDATHVVFPDGEILKRRTS